MTELRTLIERINNLLREKDFQFGPQSKTQLYAGCKRHT